MSTSTHWRLCANVPNVSERITSVCTSSSTTQVWCQCRCCAFALLCVLLITRKGRTSQDPSHMCELRAQCTSLAQHCRTDVPVCRHRGVPFQHNRGWLRGHVRCQPPCALPALSRAEGPAAGRLTAGTRLTSGECVFWCTSQMHSAFGRPEL